MHENNHKWLVDVRAQYPRHFQDARVLEIGAKDWNGSARRHFTNCDYVGVDREPGPGVDLLAVYAQEQLSRRSFDTFVALSVFEHDSEWRETLAAYLPFLRPGALLITCFGAEGNEPHEPSPWAVVPHREFLNYAATLPLAVLDAFFEEERYGKGCAGCFNCLLRHESSDSDKVAA